MLVHHLARLYLGQDTLFKNFFKKLTAGTRVLLDPAFKSMNLNKHVHLSRELSGLKEQNTKLQSQLENKEEELLHLYSELARQ